jgi:DNA primase
MMERPIELVLSRVKGCRKEGEGFKACCPAHDDRDPSLSVTEGADGRVLLKCFGQDCAVQEIVSRLGLEMSDLFPKSASRNGHKET